MSLKILVSEKGKDLLVYQNYKFHIHRVLLSGETTWRCNYKKCSSFIKTVGNNYNREITEQKLDHQHPPLSEQDLLRQELSSCAKRKATENLCDLPSKVMKTVISEVDPESETLSVRDIQLCKRNLYYARRKTLPKLPQNVSETYAMVMNVGYSTNRGEPFLLKSGNGCIIFTCLTNLAAICSSEYVHMDGTFKFCVRHYYQLFTLFGFINDQYIPLVFCVLENKSMCTYEYCLRFIKDECRKNGFTFDPKNIVIDFEMAIHAACNSIWPDTDIVGCRFHLAKHG